MHNYIIICNTLDWFRILPVITMDCLKNENVCSVKKENNLGYYRLHTIWRKDGFFINIASKNGAWRGEMTPSDVAKMCVQLELEPETYLSQCKKALTYHGGQPGMVYAVEDGSFSWKRVEDEDSGIKLKMGSVMLEPSSFEDTIQNLVTAALNCNRNLEEKLKEMTEENKKILENRNELLNKLNELIKTKEVMENDLYSRFMLLNNAKKIKIRELESLLENEYKKNKHNPSKKSENPYEVDTDTDSDEVIPTNSISIMKRKTGENNQANVKKMTQEPEEKKAKSNDEDDIGEKSEFQCSNYPSDSSPKPSTSAGETKIQSNIEKMSLTKDELYDYFYGEL